MKRVLLLFFLFTATFAFAQENKYVFVFLNKRADAPQLAKEESDKLMEGHMANINRLAAEGKLAAAGPFDGGGGIFIFNSSSVATVKDWVATDPAAKAGRWNIEILPYYPLIGGVCPVKEPYQMTSYSVVLFKPKVMKFNVQEAAETMEKHHQFVKALAKDINVVTHGSFGSNDGGILIINGDVDQAAILKDPAIDGALLEPEFKKLYVAKGSFCEK